MEKSDVVIVAVKPYLVEEVLSPVRDILKGKVLISVAVNLTFEKYEEFLLPGTHHLSTLPNTPVAVGEGIILCEERHSLTEEEFGTVRGIIFLHGNGGGCGQRTLRDRRTISGCGPAFRGYVYRGFERRGGASRAVQGAFL